MRNIEGSAPVLHQLALVIVKQDIDFNNETIHQAARVIADTKGTAYSGVNTETFQIAIKRNELLFGKGKHKIFGTNIKSSLLGAIFYSTLAISSTDYDEGHRKAVGHPASTIVPVSIILGEYLKASKLQILKSVIIGYEISTRFSNARVKNKITSYSSGRWGAIGAAATASYLLNLSVEQTMYALSNAAILSPAMLGGSTDVSTGSMSKEGVAWAVQSAVQSTLFSKDDFVGPYLFVDDHDKYITELLLDGLGESWLINSNYFKPFSCCRWLHSAITALLFIKNENNLINNNIESIEVKIFERAINLIGNEYPENTIQAQFHLPYCIALGMLFDEVTPKHFSSDNLKNDEIRYLINKIVLKKDKGYTDMFPEKLPSKVTINTISKKQFSKEIISAPWDADNPPSDNLLYQKFISQVSEKNSHVWDELFDY